MKYEDPVYSFEQVKEGVRWLLPREVRGYLILDLKSKVYARGQKDHRNARNNEPDFFTAEGERINRVQAYRMLTGGDALEARA